MKILDCTFRDGGYYTNWDFDKNIVDTYISLTNALPIDYIELGYRNNPSKEYLGKYGYCPKYELENIRSKSNKKLAIMLNEKSTSLNDLDLLLNPIKGLVDMVRLAINPKNFDRAMILAEAAKKMGFEVSFNTMYMSDWKSYGGFLDQLSNIEDLATIFVMVDSYGGVSPQDVKDTITLVREKTSCPLGFHGHNNLELALINTITAIEEGIDCVDATILGMGRGAGNLKMELLLTYLNKYYKKDLDFNMLGDLVAAFSDLHKKYGWGTNLPYMISGSNSLPQKDVMDWYSNRIYSFNSIVRALDNRKSKLEDNAHYPLLAAKKYEKVLIVGGGESSIKHSEAIKKFVSNQQDFAMVFATSRHAALFNDLDCDKYYCLVGNESKRLSQNIKAEEFSGVCVLPPYPREMGTEVPAMAENNIYEIEKISFCNKYNDSCTAIALELASKLSENIFIVSYDGYPGTTLSNKEMTLANENKELFEIFKANHSLVSLTPSLYKILDVASIYQYIE